MPVILALCGALDIVMPRNLIRFVDSYFKQIAVILQNAIDDQASSTELRHHPDPAEDKCLREMFNQDFNYFDSL